MAVGVSHQFVGLLARCIQAQRMVNIVVNRKRYGRIGAVNARAARVDEMLDAIVPTAFEDVSKADEVAVNVRERILNRIPDSGLCREVYNALGFVRSEGCLNRRPISQIRTQVGVTRMVSMPGEACLLDGWIVVIVVVVDADNFVPPFKQSECDGRTDKAGRARDKDFHADLALSEK